MKMSISDQKMTILNHKVGFVAEFIASQRSKIIWQMFAFRANSKKNNKSRAVKCVFWELIPVFATLAGG